MPANEPYKSAQQRLVRASDRLTFARPKRKPIVSAPKPFKAPTKPAFSPQDLTRAKAAAESIIKEAGVRQIPQRNVIQSIMAQLTTGNPDKIRHLITQLDRTNAPPAARKLIGLFAEQELAARKKK